MDRLLSSQSCQNNQWLLASVLDSRHPRCIHQMYIMVFFSCTSLFSPTSVQCFKIDVLSQNNSLSPGKLVMKNLSPPSSSCLLRMFSK